MQCAACSAEITLAPGENVGFRDTCERCDADLHSCRNCEHYEPGAHNDCREPSSEWVSDRERANRCDWFRASGRPGGSDAGRPSALADLDALFKKG